MFYDHTECAVSMTLKLLQVIPGNPQITVYKQRYNIYFANSGRIVFADFIHEVTSLHKPIEAYVINQIHVYSKEIKVDTLITKA
jgi:hypothetical protein